MNEFQNLFLEKYNDIPDDYTWEHLWKYRRYKLRTSRLKKKFRKNPRKYISKKVNTYLGVRKIGEIAAGFILDVMGREGFARKLLPAVQTGGLLLVQQKILGLVDPGRLFV